MSPSDDRIKYSVNPVHVPTPKGNVHGVFLDSVGRREESRKSLVALLLMVRVDVRDGLPHRLYQRCLFCHPIDPGSDPCQLHY
jgi:hypothetical protein